MRRAVFPGTFDPITLGHVDIIKRALPLFDELIIAIGTNSDKKTMFSLEERIKFIEDVFKNESQIKVKSYTGLTANFCKNEKAQFTAGLTKCREMVRLRVQVHFDKCNSFNIV